MYIETVNETSAQSARCLRCGRRIWAVSSLRAQYGPGCRAKIRQAAAEAVAADFKPDQFAKALELISDGGLVAHPHRGVYLAASSRGDAVYLTHPSGNCTCPCGLRARSLCFHVAAARVMDATRNALAKAA